MSQNISNNIQDLTPSKIPPQAPRIISVPSSFAKKWWLLMLLSLLPLIFYLFVVYTPFSVKHSWELLEGEIVSVVEKKSCSRSKWGGENCSWHYYPEIEFSYQGEELRSVAVNRSTIKRTYQVGDRQAFYYSASKNAIVTDKWWPLQNNFWICLLLFLLLFFLWCKGFLDRLRWKMMVKALKSSGIHIRRSCVALFNTGTFIATQGYYIHLLFPKGGNNAVSSHPIIDPEKLDFYFQRPKNTVCSLEGEVLENIVTENYYYSDSIPTSKLSSSIGDTVFSIYIDPLDPERYYVELEK